MGVTTCHACGLATPAGTGSCSSCGAPIVRSADPAAPRRGGFSPPLFTSMLLIEEVVRARLADMLGPDEPVVEVLRESGRDGPLFRYLVTTDRRLLVLENIDSSAVRIEEDLQLEGKGAYISRSRRLIYSFDEPPFGEGSLRRILYSSLQRAVDGMLEEGERPVTLGRATQIDADGRSLYFCIAFTDRRVIALHLKVKRLLTRRDAERFVEVTGSDSLAYSELEDVVLTSWGGEYDIDVPVFECESGDITFLLEGGESRSFQTTDLRGMRNT